MARCLRPTLAPRLRPGEGRGWLRFSGRLPQGGERRWQATEIDGRTFGSAKEAVDAGLVALEKDADPAGAKALFQQALKLNPTEQEAGAAAYNIVCCYVKQEAWQEAADQLVSVVNDYRLAVDIPKKDADLAPLRQRPEWEEALARLQGGMTQDMRYNMISELRSPFRLFRFYLFGGLSIGAGVGLIFIAVNLVKAIQEGEPLQQPLQNLGVNTVALVVLLALFLRDYRAREKQKQVIEREEKLSKLKVERAPGQSVSLAELRGIFRPVIVCGSKSHCRRSVEASRPFSTALKERGVAVIPVAMVDIEPQFQTLKEEFRSTSEGFGAAQKTGDEARRRAELTPVQLDDWKGSGVEMADRAESICWLGGEGFLFTDARRRSAASG